MHIIAGIDPGLKGGIAIQLLLDTRVYPMPLAEDGKSIYLGKVASLLNCYGVSTLILEKVGAMPGQGSVSTFNFGVSFGAILGIAAALNIQVVTPSPREWKRLILKGIEDKKKAGAIEYANREYPAIPLVLDGCRQPHDGIADALCLLDYGKYLLGVKNIHDGNFDQI